MFLEHLNLDWNTNLDFPQACSSQSLCFCNGNSISPVALAKNLGVILDSFLFLISIRSVSKFCSLHLQSISRMRPLVISTPTVVWVCNIPLTIFSLSLPLATSVYSNIATKGILRKWKSDHGALCSKPSRDSHLTHFGKSQNPTMTLTLLQPCFSSLSSWLTGYHSQAWRSQGLCTCFLCLQGSSSS